MAVGNFGVVRGYLLVKLLVSGEINLASDPRVGTDRGIEHEVPQDATPGRIHRQVVVEIWSYFFQLKRKGSADAIRFRQQVNSGLTN